MERVEKMRRGWCDLWPKGDRLKLNEQEGERGGGEIALDLSPAERGRHDDNNKRYGKRAMELYAV